MGAESDGGGMTGDEIRALRQRLGISRAELAYVLGRHYTTVTRWEWETHPVGEQSRLALLGLAEAPTNWRSPE